MTLTAHGAGAIAVSAFALPALGFAAGSALFERPEVRWSRSARPRTSRTTPTSRRSSPRSSGVGEIGKTTVYMRAHNEDIDGPVDRDVPGTGDFVAISTRCMHLGCPVRYVEASARFICPCHGGVYDFAGEVSGGPPVRPLDRFYVRVQQRPGRGRAALLGQLRVQALPELPRSRPGPRRHRPVPVPRALLDAQAGLDAHEAAQAPRAPAPPRAPAARRSGPARRAKPGPIEQAKEAGISRGRLGRRAHVAVRRPALGDVPQGAQGHELVLHARVGDDVRVPLAGRDRRLPGDVLPARTPPAAPTSRSATSPTRSSSASSCAACTSGARR